MSSEITFESIKDSDEFTIWYDSTNQCCIWQVKYTNDLLRVFQTGEAYAAKHNVDLASVRVKEIGSNLFNRYLIFWSSSKQGLPEYPHLTIEGELGCWND